MTIDTLAQGLVYGTKWSSNYITYSFRDIAPSYEYANDAANSSTPPYSLRIAAQDIFDYIERFTNLHFTYTSGIGDIYISSKKMDNPTMLGYTYTPLSTSNTLTKDQGGDVYISDLFRDIDFTKGAMGWSTLVHEIGHALGLQHPFSNPTYTGIDISDTVMSYNPYQGYDNFNNHSFDFSNFTTYDPADIKALQSLYGKHQNTTDDTYILKDMLFSQTTSSHTGEIQDDLYTIYDDAGDDTISLANLSQDQYIDLNPLSYSAVTIGYTHHYLTLTQDTTIENLIGSQADDTIILNNANNFVDAKSGIDIVEVNTQADIRVDKLQDKIVLSSSSSGFDILQNVEELYINGIQIITQDYQREQISFQDYNLAASIDRLYLSAFDRLADKAGLEYWVSRFDENFSMQNTANSFIISQEFHSLYGSKPTQEEYVTLLYHNVLLRDPDTAGLNYWLTQMQDGFTKADTLLSFSESQEFINLTGVYFENHTAAVS